jgi:hypothetical protein
MGDIDAMADFLHRTDAAGLLATARQHHETFRRLREDGAVGSGNEEETGNGRNPRRP